MSRGRSALGIAAGVILVLSSAMHSLLGGAAMGQNLAKTNAPADLVLGLQIGWHFAGLAILVFGVLALMTFTATWRGRPAAMAPMRVIGGAYLLYGIGAFVVSGRDPFFFIFIVPGLMLLAAAGKGWS